MLSAKYSPPRILNPGSRKVVGIRPLEENMAGGISPVALDAPLDAFQKDIAF